MTYFLSWERNKIFIPYFLTLNNKCQIVSFSNVMIAIRVQEGGHTRGVIVQF